MFGSKQYGFYRIGHFTDTCKTARTLTLYAFIIFGLRVMELMASRGIEIRTSVKYLQPEVWANIEGQNRIKQE